MITTRSIDDDELPKKFISRQKDIDILSQFSSSELKIELERLLDEQKIYLAEISQLKNERNMLFDLLKSKKNSKPKPLPKKTFFNEISFSLKPEDLTISNDRIVPSFSFTHFETVSIPPSTQNKSLILSKNAEFHIHTTLEDASSQVESPRESRKSELFEVASLTPVPKKKYKNAKTQASCKSKDTCEFSKSALIKLLNSYELPIYDKAADVISCAQSGDAIVSYLTKLCGNRIANDQEDIAFLNNEVIKMNERNKIAMSNTMESLKIAHEREVELRSALSASLKSHLK